MKKGNAVILAKVIFSVGVIVAGYIFFSGIASTETIKIANWNLEMFGQAKASDAGLMNFYADKINDYDIIFIQEIKDKSQEAFQKLCSLLKNYSCDVSSRAGRTSSKEQYGVIYKDDVELIYLKDYNPDKNNRWERPPIEVAFSKNGYSFTIYNIHTKPDDVQEELYALRTIISDYGNVVVLGDLNADCSYYDNKNETEFNDWNWLIKDDADTTSTATNCAYDRIIVNDNAKEEVVDYGIDTNKINESISNHYPVWVKLKVN